MLYIHKELRLRVSGTGVAHGANAPPVFWEGELRDLSNATFI